MIARVRELLRARPLPADVAAALDALWVAGGAITRSAIGESLAEAQSREERIRIEPGVYTRMPTTEGRVRLLRLAARIAPAIEVHAPLAGDGTYVGRIVFDGPRLVGRAIGLPAPEPGDRFEGEYRHAFFDDEELIAEAAAAGLVLTARRGAWVVLEVGAGRHERADTFTREILRVLAIIGRVERARRESPNDAVGAMRAIGRRAGARGPIGRARLRRAIGWVDASFVRARPNCFRRVLAEVALDGGAAEETLVFGLDVGRTGHVAFKDAEELRFDVAFEIPPG